MKRTILIVALGMLSASCSTPMYVLHYRAPTHFGNFISPPKEDTPIAESQGVALCYDRARWVAEEPIQNDGTAWVHYAVVLKNTNNQNVQIKMDQVRLQQPSGLEALAVYETADREHIFNTIEPKTSYRITAKFHLPKQMVDNYGGSSDPIEIVVPIQGGGEVRQKIWLWKI